MSAKFGLARQENAQRRRCMQGQVAVEFALVSIVLFMLSVGILETGRLLFTYSVVSNAAHEGSRYGIVRPRDVIGAGPAATQAAMGRPVPTELVVPDGICNVVDKARQKVWGINPSDVRVDVWYDKGDSTPIAVGNDPATPTTYYNYVIRKGNRIVVQTHYNFQFVAPFLSQFVPNGIDVRMTSARSMENDGTSPGPPCTTNYTPAPTNTVTATPASTARPTNTSTPVLPTPTPVLPINRLVITRLDARKPDGALQPLDVVVSVTDDQGVPVAGATTQMAVTLNGIPQGLPVTIPDKPGEPGIYELCAAGNYTGGSADTVVVAITVV